MEVVVHQRVRKQRYVLLAEQPLEPADEVRPVVARSSRGRQQRHNPSTELLIPRHCPNYHYVTLICYSGFFPARAGDGIARDPAGGDGAGTVVRRAPDYGAPVCSHFGDNVYAAGGVGKPCDPYGGCTLCDPSKIRYIDELDPEDTVERRLQAPLADRAAGVLRAEVERHGDGVVCVTVFVPASPRVAEAAALAMARRMGLDAPEVISQRLMHPAEGSVFEIKGVLDVAVRVEELALPALEAPLGDTEIEAWVRPRRLAVVAATVGEDEHSVGLHEILDVKHGGLEKYGFDCHDLGTSVPIERVLDAAVRRGACAVLISTIVTHARVHETHMRRLHALAVQRGVREHLVLVAGGTQVTDELARACGVDKGFGRGTTGRDVASFLVRTLRRRDEAAAGGHPVPTPTRCGD